MRLHIPFIGQRMKILFAGRPHTPVRLNIPDVVEIDLSSKSRYSEKDITEYVRDGISKLDDLKLPIELRDEIEKVLIEGANGMFLWVFLILDDLRNSKQTTREAIQDKLKTLPKGLPKLYRNILTKIEPGDVEIAKTILQWVVWATRPLHVRELAVAIAIRPEHTSISSMQEEIDFSLERQIRRIFGPLIKIEDRTVHLIHQSAKDFLCDPEEINETLLHCPTGAVSSNDESNLQIASSCLVVLAFDDIKDCTKPKDRCDLDMWNIDKREQDPWALDQQSVDQFQRTMHNQFGTRIIAYALQNWIDHVMRLSEESRMCSRLIELFGKVAKYPHKIYLAYSGDMVHHGIPSQSSPLEIEAFLGHNGFVNILIDLVSTRKGAAQNARCMIYGEALHNAALAGSYEIVRELLSRGADVFGYGREYGTALTAAAMCGHEQIVRLLIEKGAGVNACGEDRGCPLLGAAATGRESIVRLLIDSGADVDAVNIDFGSPLLAAADHGHESVVRLLINNGADVNPVILGDYSSPLRTASQRGHHSIVRLLINSGADWDIC
jgi:ankyrin repeat protein